MTRALAAALMLMVALSAVATVELPDNGQVVVAPLMDSEWHQRRPFNDFMPVDWADMPSKGNEVKNESKRGRMTCGCVADAMGQILRYFKWPVRLDKTVSFEHNWKNERNPAKPWLEEPYESPVTGKMKFRVEGHVPFEYASMTNVWEAVFKDARGTFPEIDRYPAARLIQTVGVLLQMDYRTTDSGSYPYTMTEQMTDWYETPAFKTCNGSFANAKADILACLQAGIPVTASLPGHQIVIHGYAKVGEDDYVFVAWDNQSEDGWTDASTLSINEACIGFKPKKMVQLEPLRAVEDTSVTVRWTLPEVWTSDVAGFTAVATPAGGVAVTKSVGAADRACTFSGLTPGQTYSFNVTPTIAGAVVSPSVTTTIATAAKPALAWPTIEVWGPTTNAFGETWYHENATDKGFVYVRCPSSVTDLSVVSGNLTALPQDKITVRSYGAGNYAVVFDGSGVTNVPSSAGISSMNRQRMIATLAATDANGTTVYKNLSLRFSSDTPIAEPDGLTPTDPDPGPGPDPTAAEATNAVPLSVSLGFVMTADNDMKVSYDVATNGVSRTWEDGTFTFTESDDGRNLWRGDGNQNIGANARVKRFLSGTWAGFPVPNTNLEQPDGIAAGKYWEIDVPFDLRAAYPVTNVFPKAFITTSAGADTDAGQPVSNNKQLDVTVAVLSSDKTTTQAVTTVRTGVLGATRVNEVAGALTTTLSNGVLRIRVAHGAGACTGAFGGIQGISFAGAMTAVGGESGGDEGGGGQGGGGDDDEPDDPTPVVPAGADPGAGVPPDEADGEIEDIRVDALVKSHWDQLYAGGAISFGEKCYNYYTPRVGGKNAHCGCVATALAQVMRYHAWPREEVERKTYKCRVYRGVSDPAADSFGMVATNLTMVGGTYDWSKMPLTTTAETPDGEREMIGRLCYDVGVAMSSKYENGQTSAGGFAAIHTFPKNFHYASCEAIYWDITSNMKEYSLARFQDMVVPCLDAGLPCQLAISGPSGGHSVVCDGYGFDKGRFMVHINAGYTEKGDGWYSPTNFVRVCGIDYTKVDGVTYNISPTNTGAIASGRVLDLEGRPVADATVLVRLNGKAHKTMSSNAKGVYFFWGESGTYDITAIKDGVVASTQATLQQPQSVAVTQDGGALSTLAAVTVGNSAWNDIVLADVARVDPPVASQPDGTTFEGSLSVTFSCPTADAVIHYTTDGTTPTALSEICSGPIVLTETTLVKAVAVRAGMQPSEIVACEYVEATLGTALECPSLVWRTGASNAGFNLWHVVTDHKDTGVSSLRSGEVIGMQTSKGASTWLEADVKGPASLSFKYDYQQLNYCAFVASLDGVEFVNTKPDSSHAKGEWIQGQCDIPAGMHTIRFAYVIGGSGHSAWPDYGAWLDKVTYVYAGADEDSGPSVAGGDACATIKENAVGEHVVAPAKGVDNVTVNDVGAHTIVVPPAVAFVFGVPAQQLRVKSGTNDVTKAFFLHEAGDLVALSLNDDGVVTFGDDDIPVRPALTSSGDAVKPLSVGTAALVGVKTIPGLTYTLWRETAIEDLMPSIGAQTAHKADEQTADGTRLQLSDTAPPAGRAFYVIQVRPPSPAGQP